MFEDEAARLYQIDDCLYRQDYAALERITFSELDNNLLSEQTLEAARALRLTPTVIYLATLAKENLPNSATFSRWLMVYQSISIGRATDDLIKKSSRHPLERVARLIIAENPSINLSEMRKLKADNEGWRQAIELAIDFGRYDAVENLVSELVRRKVPLSDWLSIAKTLLSRYKGVLINDRAGALGRSYVSIRRQIPSTSQSLIVVRSNLALFASRCFLEASNYQGAIDHALRVTTPDDKLMAAFDIAKAYCHMGCLDESVSSLDDLIGMIVDRGHFLGDEQSRQKQENSFDPEVAARALVDLQTVLADVGQKAFLVSGTLLGYAREGKLLAHDKDLDVGIIGWEDQFDVVNALLKSGKFSVDIRHVNGSKTYHLPVMHLATRVSIDVFIYHSEGGKYVTGVESKFGYLQNFAFSPFELMAVRFLGIDFYVPSDVERNLAENFGNWRISDPGYISHLESPSTVDVGGPVYQLVGRLRAFEALRDRKLEKLSRVIRLMSDHQSRPLGMSQKILDKLQEFLINQREEVVA